jgi:tetratricopeptide (TPR) repeat protein
MMFVFILFLLTGGMSLCADIPAWIPLREALYEQKLKADEIKPVYRTALSSAQENYSGADLDIALSRCEFIMGRALAEEKRNEEARVHFNEGMRLAEKAIESKPSSDAWLIRSENLSQACALGPWTYTAANGLNVEKYAKNALALNSRNAAAQYLVAARWVFAPAPFSNIKKGIEMMKDIPANADMDKDDSFNVYSAIGYGYIQQKKYDEAKPWILKSLEIYPTNKYAAGLLNAK